MELRDVRALYLAPWRRLLLKAVPLRADLVVAALLVAALAAVNFLVGLDEPRGAIWDESYYFTSVQRYRDQTVQFASHPPLGLMIMAAGDALMQPERSAADGAELARDKQIAGDRLPRDFRFASMRVASGVFAVLGAVLFFMLMRSLAAGLVPALLLSNFYLFDNALIAHFRAAHLDAFQMVFLLCALLCFVVSARRGARSSPWLELAMSAFIGLALMVKLNVAPFALLPVLLVARRFWMGRDRYPLMRRCALAFRDLSASAVGGVLACLVVFCLHVVSGSNRPDFGTPAGAKDARFISVTYDEYLKKERGLSPSVLLAAASDYARFMAADYQGMTRVDSNGSHPFQWPFNSKAITYRWDSDGTRTAYVVLTGNPIGWGIAVVALAAAVALLIVPAHSTSVASRSDTRALIAMLLLVYAAFMALHLYLDAHRVLYLYHYFPGLLLSFCLVPLLFDEASRRWPRFARNQHAVLASLMGLVLVAFLFVAPLTFHRPLTPAEYEIRLLP